MSSYSTNTLNIKERHISPFLVFNASIYILSAICFMIYTTQQHYVHAEGDGDLGYDISSVDASVTVGTACTFTGTVTAPHTATIANGINSTDIGTTVLNTKCNDSGGYALYAIGYTGDEYGATDLAYTSLDGATTNSDYNIATGTATSGNTSNWSMKLSPVAGTTTATIENGYSSYNIVPDDYTKVATLNTVTDSANTSTPTGSSVSTTYQSYISPTQPAGTYTGKVKYTLVHPSTAPKPIIPDISKVTYMQDFAKFSSSEMATLKNSMVENQQYQLKDSRDEKTYYISKLADGNIWMTQNLDLDLSTGAELTPANTNISSNWTPVNSTIVFSDTIIEDWQNDYNVPYSADPGELYIYSSGTTDDDDQYATLADCQAAHPDCSMHNHVGNYYNWSSAVANNNTSSIATQYTNAETSICPAGWKLPTGRQSNKPLESNELGTLINNYGILGPSHGCGGTCIYYDYADRGFNSIRIAPLWLMRSGGVIGDSPSEIGKVGYYWSSTVNNSYGAYYLFFNSGYIMPTYWDYNRQTGQSIRCVAR